MPFRKLPGAQRCTFKKGEIIIELGEPTTYVYYLVKGSAGRHSFNDEGEDSVTIVKNPNGNVQSCLGALALFRAIHDKDLHYNSEFYAKSDCECYRLPAEEFYEFVVSNPYMLVELIDQALKFSGKLLARLENRCRRTSAQLLCSELMTLMRQQGDRMMVPKHFRNTDLSQSLALHSVTVSKIMGKLKEQGIVERTPDGLWIKDVDQLKRYATEEELKYR